MKKLKENTTNKIVGSLLSVHFLGEVYSLFDPKTATVSVKIFSFSSFNFNCINYDMISNVGKLI